MTVTATDRRAGPFYGNGVTTQFPFTFKVFSAADLEVTYTNAAGVASVITSGFTVTLNADQDANPGGYITYPLSGSPMASPASLVAIGATAYSQPAAFSNVGRFLPEVHERAFDRQAILSQQLAEKLGRQLTIPPDGPFPVTALPTRAARYDRLLCFADLSGQPNVTPFTVTQVASTIAAAYTGAAGPVDALSFIQSGTGAGPRTAQAKMRDAVHLKDFSGVTGDDVANDTVGVQAALNSGHKFIDTSGGTYSVTQLTVPSGVTLFGGGTFKARSTTDSILYLEDKDDVTIRGVKFDGNSNVKSCVRGYTSGTGVTNLTVEDCTFKGMKTDATLQYGAVEVSRLSGSLRSSNITIRNNLVSGGGSHGFIVAYADDVSVNSNVILNVGQHGAEAVDCTDVVMSGNLVRSAGSVGPGGSALGVGAHCRNWSITGNVIYNCGGDAPITVEHNSVEGSVTGNTILNARTSGINVSFGTAASAPFDRLHDITISGNTIIGDGVNTTNRVGILMYSSTGSGKGDNITVTGNTIRKFNCGIDANYFDGATISGNSCMDYVGSSSVGLRLSWMQRTMVVGNALGVTTSNCIQLLTYGGSVCDRVTMVANSGSTDAGAEAQVYIEGTGTHAVIGHQTGGATNFIETAGASSIVSIGNYGNLSSTTHAGSGTLLTSIGNSNPQGDFMAYGGDVKDLKGSGSPEGVVTAPVGSTYRRSNGGTGTTFYVKETGSGNTGWIAK